MPEPKAIIDPRELESFEKVRKSIDGARSRADEIAEVPDRETLGRASDALREIKFVRKDAEEARKAEKAPYTETGRRIDIDFKEVQSTLLAAEERLKEKVAEFHARERKAHEEERKREQRNAERRQERENARAEKEGRNAHSVKGPPTPPPPPKSGRGSMGQTVVKDVLKYQVEDESQVPDHFFDRVLSKSRLRAAVLAGEAIPGVRTWKEPEVATR